MRRLLILLVTGCLVAVGIVVAASCNDTPAPNLVPVVGGAERRFVFQLEGDKSRWPYHDALYVKTTSLGVEGAWEIVAIGDEGRFNTVSRVGERWWVRSEDNPTAAESRIFWNIDVGGTFADSEAPVLVRTPERTAVIVNARKDEIGSELLSFFDPETGMFGTVLNNPHGGFFERAFVPGEPHDVYLRMPQPRPFRFDDFAPRKYRLAVQAEGHLWTTGDVELVAGETLVVEAGSQPESGGTVIVENADAILLLHGDFPIAAPHRQAEFVYRETWNNVPPGKHKIRYPDGKTIDVVAVDGETTKIPKR